jgi:hypothetical protein
MVLNLSQLIKIRYRDSSCCLDTVYLGCRPTRSCHKFLQSHLDSFTVTPNYAPSTGIRPSTGIIPSCNFTVTQNSQPSTGIIPSGSFVWTPKLSAICRDFYLDQKHPAVYRDCAKTHASACRCRQHN